MSEKEKRTEYERICDKLGFIPSQYKLPAITTEDDNIANPFSVLTSKEITFLYRNGYFFVHTLP